MHKILVKCMHFVPLGNIRTTRKPRGLQDLSSLDQGSNPCPQQWKHRVLTTGPPGNSQETFLNRGFFPFIFVRSILGEKIWRATTYTEPFLLKVENYSHVVISSPSKSPLKWKWAGGKMKPSVKENKREVISERDFQELLPDAKQLKQGNWCNKAEGPPSQRTMGGWSSSEGGQFDPWNQKCSRLGNTRHTKGWNEKPRGWLKVCMSTEAWATSILPAGR